MTKIRYKCIAGIDGQQLIFKRYGENEEQVRTELLAFIKEVYEREAQILEVQPDKTHPVEQQEQISNADTTKPEGQSDV